jgi:hypothetical protein
MAMSGTTAVVLLEALSQRCELLRKDATDKMWAYRMRYGPRREFAFDPKTTTRLVVRLDTRPPPMVGLVDVENIEAESVSTALSRVFTGGNVSAKWKVRVEDEYALVRLLEHLEKAE